MDPLGGAITHLVSGRRPPARWPEVLRLQEAPPPIPGRSRPRRTSPWWSLGGSNPLFCVVSPRRVSALWPNKDPSGDLFSNQTKSPAETPVFARGRGVRALALGCGGFRTGIGIGPNQDLTRCFRQQLTLQSCRLCEGCVLACGCKNSRCDFVTSTTISTEEAAVPCD